MKNNKKGFTLAELLIVIAIMAILIAIAIPVFSSQMENARHAVDTNAERSAKSMTEAHFLLEHANDGHIVCSFCEDKDGNMKILKCTVFNPADTNKKCSITLDPPTDAELEAACKCDASKKGSLESNTTNKHVYVWADKNGVKSAWAASAPTAETGFGAANNKAPTTPAGP